MFATCHQKQRVAHKTRQVTTNLRARRMNLRGMLPSNPESSLDPSPISRAQPTPLGQWSFLLPACSLCPTGGWLSTRPAPAWHVSIPRTQPERLLECLPRSRRPRAAWSRLCRWLHLLLPTPPSSGSLHGRSLCRERSSPDTYPAPPQLDPISSGDSRDASSRRASFHSCPIRDGSLPPTRSALLPNATFSLRTCHHLTLYAPGLPSGGSISPFSTGRFCHLFCSPLHPRCWKQLPPRDRRFRDARTNEADTAQPTVAHQWPLLWAGRKGGHAFSSCAAVFSKIATWLCYCSPCHKSTVALAVIAVTN